MAKPISNYVYTHCALHQTCLGSFLSLYPLLIHEILLILPLTHVLAAVVILYLLGVIASNVPK